jgi:mxaJ protein
VRNIHVVVATMLLGLPAAACGRKTVPGEVWIEPKPAAKLAGLDVRRAEHVDLEDERGHAVLLSFGYTACVDVCPGTLGKLHSIFSGLGTDAERVRAFYVSVDPERDQPARFGRFMSHFDERIQGVFIEPAALGPVLSAYGVTAVKRPPNLRRYVGQDVDPKADYSMDHSSGMWAVDPRGRLRVHYGYDVEPSVIVAGLRSLLVEPAPKIEVRGAKVLVYESGAGAAYFTLENSGADGDRLVSAESPSARAVSLHESIHEGDVVRMQAADAGFAVAAHARVALQSGGKHLMLTGVSLPAAAQQLPLVLHFERSAPLRLSVPVERPGGARQGDLTRAAPAPVMPAAAAPMMPAVAKDVLAASDAAPPAEVTPASFAVSGGAPPPRRRVLYVCSDPNNLPLSNRRGEGFENRIASVVARALHADLAYLYWPERRGFLRMTLNAGRCDVVLGVPVGTERVLTTAPYYRSGYVFVYGARAPHVRSLAAPELSALRIGVPLVGDDGANPPPVLALVSHGLTANLRGYSVYGDYRDESPPSELVQAVRRGDVDIAIAWGPLAGYYARKSEPHLALAPLPESEAPPGLTFRFEFAMAVRKDDAPLRDELNRVLVERRQEIDRILAAFSVPRL